MPLAGFQGLLPGVSEATQILGRISQGDPHAAEQLLPLVYEELRNLEKVRIPP